MSLSPDLTTNFDQALSHLERELSTLRTGRATPALIEELPVDCYGSRSPLQQVASISAPEPRLLVVQPWDPSIVKDIEKAITASSLGITPVVDGKLLRLPFPSMTEERRKDMLKVVNEKAEATRVRIRGIREDELKHLRQAEKDGDLSEDALAADSKELQTQVEAANAKVVRHVEAKTQEIMTV